MAVVGGDEGGDDREAEAGAAAFAAGAGGVDAVEAFEDPGGLIGLEAGALVGDLDDAVAVARCRRRCVWTCRAGCGRSRCRRGWRRPGAAGPRRRGRRRGPDGPVPPGPVRKTGRVASRAVVSCRASAARVRRSMGASCRGRLSSARARVSRSSTRPPIRIASFSIRLIVRLTSASSDSAPIRYSSAKPRMPTSGVRSSWLASATKRRIRASDSARAAKADSIRASMTLSAVDSRPASVRGEACGIRCDSGRPAAISVAVASIRCSGRSPARIANQPATPSRAVTTAPISWNAVRRPAVVEVTSSRETATTTLAGRALARAVGCSVPDGSGCRAALGETGTMSTRQPLSPWSLGIVERSVECGRATGRRP